MLSTSIPVGLAHLLDALHDDVERIHQHGERDRDLHRDQHRAGAVAQQRGKDGTDTEVHVNSPLGTHWLFRYWAGGSRPTRQAGYRPAASVAAMARITAHMTPTASMWVSS